MTTPTTALPENIAEQYDALAHHLTIAGDERAAARVRTLRDLTEERIAALQAPPDFHNADHMARLLKVFTTTITEMADRPADAARQVLLYAESAINAAEKAAARTTELAHSISEAARVQGEDLAAQVRELEATVRERGEALAGYQQAIDQQQRTTLEATQRAEKAEADAKHWHDTYQQAANGHDAFLTELLSLLPGATDTGMDAYDQIPRGIEQIKAELAAATTARDRHGHRAQQAEGERDGLSRRVISLEATVQRVRAPLDRAVAASWSGTPEGDAVREALDALGGTEGDRG